MSYDSWKTTDRSGDDAAAEERANDRAEEELTAARWEEFIARMRKGSTPTLLRTVADLMEERRDPYYALSNVHIDAFAEEFGWADTITAIARAERENRAEQIGVVDAELRKRAS